MRLPLSILGLVALYLGSYSLGLACECRPMLGEDWQPETVRRNITQSSSVFIGEVVKAGKNRVGLLVLDVFKGALAHDTLYSYDQYTSCSIVPRTGLWIIYGQAQGDTINIRHCSLSRSLSDPLVFVLPPPNASPRQLAEYTNDLERAKRLELQNWTNEYMLLAAYRNQAQHAQPAPAAVMPYLAYVALAIALLALGVALRKRQPD